MEKADYDGVDAEEGLGRGGRDGSESMGKGVLVGGKRGARRLSNGGACWATGGPVAVDVEKAWSARRRDPRINGADLYVARVTKVGMGSAKPCWRCLEWCRWAGVKRIFHWNGEDGKFDMVKVNTAERDQYETHADIRLFAGMVRCRFFPSSVFACFFFSCCASCRAGDNDYELVGPRLPLTARDFGMSIYHRFCSHRSTIILTSNVSRSFLI